jgi:hypothetical protein
MRVFSISRVARKSLIVRLRLLAEREQAVGMRVLARFTVARCVRFRSSLSSQ